jgi:hypothetical protein
MVIEFKQAIGVRTKFKQKKSNRVGWQGKSCSCRSVAYNTMVGVGGHIKIKMG